MPKAREEVRLPEGFEPLQKYVVDWALPTQTEREAQRRASTPEELQAFYEEMMPYIERILKEVDRYPIGSLPQALETLFLLAFSLAEIAPNVELYGGGVLITHVFDERRFNARHGDNLSAKGLHSH